MADLSVTARRVGDAAEWQVVALVAVTAVAVTALLVALAASGMWEDDES